MEKQDLLTDIFEQFFADSRVGAEIGRLLRGQSMDLDDLADLFTAAGYDTATLPGVDFRQAMREFEVAFLVAAQAEQTLQGTIQTAQLMELKYLQRDQLKEMRELVSLMRIARPGSIEIHSGEIVAVREDTGQSVSVRLDPKERQRIRDEVRAQLVARDARAAIEQLRWDDAEQLTREALELDPATPGLRSALGLAMSGVVTRWFSGEHGVRDFAAEIYAAVERRSAPQQDIFVPSIEAILWLDEACRHDDDPAGRASAALALMYGVTRRYAKMLRSLEVALEYNPALGSGLRTPEHLTMLAYACGNDKEHLRELGNMLGITLPIAKADVVRSIEEMDLTDTLGAAHGIVWHVMGQPTRWSVGPGPRFPTIVRIFARDDGGQRMAQACYNIPIPFQPLQTRCVPEATGTPIDIRTLVDELATLFLFVCQAYPA